MIDLPMAYVLYRGQVEGSLFYEKINDTLDIFNIKESQTAGIAPRAGLDLGAIGDMQGLRPVLNFGLSDRFMLRYRAERQDIQFGTGTLRNVSHDIGLRYSLLAERGRRPAVSLEPIYRSNRGRGIRRRFTQVTAFGLTVIPPNPIDLEIGGVGDSTWALRILASKRLSRKFLLHGWYELASSDITSEFKTNVPIQQFTDIVNSITYTQNHQILGVGGNWRWGPRLVAGASAQKYFLDRSIDDAIPDGVTEGLAIQTRLSYAVRPKAWITLDAQYFSNQLLGKIPYVYNKFTASRFDKVYGYLGLGVTFKLDYGV